MAFLRASSNFKAISVNEGWCDWSSERCSASVVRTWSAGTGMKLYIDVCYRSRSLPSAMLVAAYSITMVGTGLQSLSSTRGIGVHKSLSISHAGRGAESASQLLAPL